MDNQVILFCFSTVDKSQFPLNLSTGLFFTKFLDFKAVDRFPQINSPYYYILLFLRRPHMKFKCHQNELSAAINMVNKAVSSKSTLPILSGIYLETKDHQLRLIGNDLNLSIETFIDAEIDREGSTVVPARLFSELIRKLPSAEIEFDISETNVVNIVCMASSYKLVGLPGNEYPELPVIEDENSFLIDKELFNNMIRQTHFAISQDEARPILTGALLEIENEKRKKGGQ